MAGEFALAQKHKLRGEKTIASILHTNFGRCGVEIGNVTSCTV